MAGFRDKVSGLMDLVPERWRKEEKPTEALVKKATAEQYDQSKPGSLDISKLVAEGRLIGLDKKTLSSASLMARNNHLLGETQMDPNFNTVQVPMTVAKGNGTPGGMSVANAGTGGGLGFAPPSAPDIASASGAMAVQSDGTSKM